MFSPEPEFWRPAASPGALRERARQLSRVRDFFARRDVMEVETPVLGGHGVTDPHIDSIAATRLPVAGGSPRGWLQTSPEYHMKRLLAAGAGSIYQISRAFRDGERGRRHNPEFSLLEWYRPGFSDVQLMDEVADLVCGWLDRPRPLRLSYGEAMERFAGVDPFTATQAQLASLCAPHTGAALARSLGRDQCLDVIMSHVVEPELTGAEPVFICDYPASQAALARTSRRGGAEVAHRFELYVDGLELCNGYWELADAAEQRRRFDTDNRQRARAGKPVMPVDEALLEALEAGLPDCAGVALGLDRLLMLKLGLDDIAEVLAFPAERA